MPVAQETDTISKLFNQYQELPQASTEALSPELLTQVQLLLDRTVRAYVGSKDASHYFGQKNEVNGTDAYETLLTVWSMAAALPGGWTQVWETCMSMTDKEIDQTQMCEVLLPVMAGTAPVDYQTLIGNEKIEKQTARTGRIADILTEYWSISSSLKALSVEQITTQTIQFRQALEKPMQDQQKLQELWLKKASVMSLKIRMLNQESGEQAAGLKRQLFTDACMFGQTASSEAFSIIDNSFDVDIKRVFTETPETKPALVKWSVEAVATSQEKDKALSSAYRAFDRLPEGDDDIAYAAIQLLLIFQQNQLNDFNKRNTLYVHNISPWYNLITKLSTGVGQIPLKADEVMQLVEFDAVVSRFFETKERRELVSWQDTQKLLKPLMAKVDTAVFDQVIRQIAGIEDQSRMNMIAVGLIGLAESHQDWFKEKLGESGIARWVHLITLIKGKYEEELVTAALNQARTALGLSDVDFIRATYPAMGDRGINAVEIRHNAVYRDVIGKYDREYLTTSKNKWRDVIKDLVTGKEGSDSYIDSLVIKLMDLNSENSQVNKEIASWREEVIKSILISGKTKHEVRAAINSSELSLDFLNLEESQQALSWSGVRLSRVEAHLCQMAVEQKQPQQIIYALDNDQIKGVDGMGLALSYLTSEKVTEPYRTQIKNGTRKYLRRWLGNLKGMDEAAIRVNLTEKETTALGSSWPSVCRVIKGNNYWSDQLLTRKIKIDGVTIKIIKLVFELAKEY